MSRQTALASLLGVLLCGCQPFATPTPIIIIVTPVVITATSPPATATPAATRTPVDTATPRVAPTLATTPYAGCMTGPDLTAWRTWDRQFWERFDVAYQAAGSFTGGNPQEAQASIEATRTFADWVNRNPPTVSNTHQYEVMLRLVRTWRDWVAELWAANNATDYDTYKEHSDNFNKLYERYNGLWDPMIYQEKLMDLCPPAVSGAEQGFSG